MEEKCYYSYDYAAYAGDPVWVGMKRGHERRSEGKLDTAVMEKRYRCAVDEKDDSQSQQPRWKHVAANAPSAGAKRGYEQSEEEIVIEAEQVDKRYKGNYWEDPAYAKLLQARGGRLAKHDAGTNQTHRLIKEIDDAYGAVHGQNLTTQ